MNDTAAIVPENQEDVEHAQGDGWDGEEIHGRDLADVVLQEGPPILRR
jgi:hypothetical protein